VSTALFSYLYLSAATFVIARSLFTAMVKMFDLESVENLSLAHNGTNTKATNAGENVLPFPFSLFFFFFFAISFILFLPFSFP